VQAPPTNAAGRKGFQQTVKDDATNAIKVSLQDCLACSGCVTTAETMLLQQQSARELLEKLETPEITVVATVSAQSRASLAAAYGMTMAEVCFLKACNVPPETRHRYAVAVSRPL
jgi:iron only hydrogenase large subunit-like protein